MVGDSFCVTQLAWGWQVTYQAKVVGLYETHCQATLAAMLLAQIASEGGISADVVLVPKGAVPRGILARHTFSPAPEFTLAAVSPGSGQHGNRQRMV